MTTTQLIQRLESLKSKWVGKPGELPEDIARNQAIDLAIKIIKESK